MAVFKAIYIKEINADQKDAVYMAKLLQPENTKLVQVVEAEKVYFEWEA